MFSQESYDSARLGAVLAHRTDRGVIRVAGSDAAAWLQGLLTNDVEGRPFDSAGSTGLARDKPGQVVYSAYLTPQGRMITDARVLRLPDGILMDVPASLAASLAERLGGLIFAEDVQVEDVSATIGVLELHGPEAPRIAASILTPHAPRMVASARDDQFGVPGYAVFVSADDRTALDTAFRAAGARAIDLDTLDVVRVESGRPAFLVDMDAETIPLEAGIEDRAISFTKGCYVGQEIIVRVTQRGGGRVAKKLVGLTFDAGMDSPPERGAIVRSGDRDIGRITSAVRSPTLGHAIALGYVHRDFLEPGTRVTVMAGNAPVPAIVATTPFV